MPTYVYKFVETGETIEVQQAFTDDSLTEAVHPGSGQMLPVKKVFTSVGVTFKGGGFYKTDARGSSSTTSSSSSGTGSANSANGHGDSASGTSGNAGSTNGTTSSSTSVSSSSSGASSNSSSSSD